VRVDDGHVFVELPPEEHALAHCNDTTNCAVDAVAQ
jgi:hypothetical protein